MPYIVVLSPQNFEGFWVRRLLGTVNGELNTSGKVIQRLFNVDLFAHLVHLL